MSAADLLRDLLGRPTEACPVATSPWTIAPVCGIVGAVVGAVAQHWWIDLPTGPLLHNNVFGGAVVGALAGFAFCLISNFLAKDQHAHCDACRTCSYAAGVPLTRTSKALDRELRAAGWFVADDEDWTTCPACRVAPADGSAA